VPMIGDPAAPAEGRTVVPSMLISIECNPQGLISCPQGQRRLLFSALVTHPWVVSVAGK
jgi:hypothetical protein